MSNDDAVQLVDVKSSASKEVDDQWILNIEALVESYGTEEIQPIKEIKEIEEIPSIYVNWKRLDDFGDVMSFLPETNRWRFVALMNQAFHLKVRECLQELQKNEDKVWRCYCGVDENSKRFIEQFRAENSQHFIECLLPISCFLIFAMLILNRDNNEKLSKILNGFDRSNDTKMRMLKEYDKLERFILGERNGIERYMLTMDYQIPLFVVDAVYTKYSTLSSELKTPIHELVIPVFQYIDPGVHKSKLHNNTITVPKDGFQHLLHIFHWSRTPKGKFHVEGKFHVIESSNMHCFYIPSATDMQLHATVFEKHVTSGFDVTFHERILSGVMLLPSGYLLLYQDEIYKHLLAFERGYGMVCGFSVTAYFACIVQLVQTEADITLLQAKGILPRIEDKNDILGSLECYKTVLSFDIPMSDDLYKLKLNAMDHHYRNTSRYYGAFKSKIRKYHEEFMSNYCSSPWITISVVGAILLFVLTFIQTIYSALSYYKQ